jgi:molybdopterin synthase sulfur carrier subunit
MPRVRFTSHLRRHLECHDADASGASVREILESVFLDQPKLRGYLLEDHGPLRKHVTVFVGGVMIQDRVGLSDAVAENDEVFVFQALSGG